MESLPQPLSSKPFEQTYDLSHHSNNLLMLSRVDLHQEKDKPSTTSKVAWLEAELTRLNSLAKEKKNWKTVAKVINLQFHHGKRIRFPRDCKETWISHRQTTQSSFWTVQEDRTLLEKKKAYGRKWNKIAEFLYEKSAQQVKCRLQFLNNKDKAKASQPIKLAAEPSNLDFGGINSDSFTSLFFDPLQSFRVQNLNDITDFGFNMARSFCDPEVQLANMILDDFCITNFGE